MGGWPLPIARRSGAESVVQVGAEGTAPSSGRSVS